MNMLMIDIQGREKGRSGGIKRVLTWTSTRYSGIIKDLRNEKEIGSTFVSKTVM